MVMYPGLVVDSTDMNFSVVESKSEKVHRLAGMLLKEVPLG